MVLSLPYKIWTYLYVIVFSFNFLDKIISIIWHSVCGCLCQWSGWLGDSGELNPVFYILPAICIFLPMCWSHTLKSLLRTLFQFSEFSLCYPDSCFLFSAVSIAGFPRSTLWILLLLYFPQILSRSFVHFRALLIETVFFLRSFLCSPDWDFPLSLWALLLQASTVLCDDREKPLFVLVFKCCLFLCQLLKGAFLHIVSHLDSLSGHKHIVSYFPCFCDSWGESCCNFGVFFSTDDLRFSPTTFNIVCLFTSYFWCFEYVIDWLFLVTSIWCFKYLLHLDVHLFSTFFNFVLLLFHGIYCLCPQFLISSYSSNL